MEVGVFCYIFSSASTSMTPFFLPLFLGFLSLYLFLLFSLFSLFLLSDLGTQFLLISWISFLAHANCTLFCAPNAQKRTGSQQGKKTIFLDVS